ncbi:uncharacterized protein J4E87_003456 [Alternaria ethzedia]|uniref:uncharacterized protein n=1 Tax=Alternaria ethzedia TaxID=181014 RepID=UPI0020C1E7DD|nr:uncharacterized protein J4E87_003456 [Alternaria ethzedia]KAI4629194.1 hypothetical protein J4E87_003456 [Alternaria ethzedia]
MRIMAPIIHIIDPDPDTVIVLKNPCTIFARWEPERGQPNDLDDWGSWGAVIPGKKKKETMKEKRARMKAEKAKKAVLIFESAESSDVFALDDGSTAPAEASSAIQHSSPPIAPEEPGEPEEQSIHYHVSSRHLMLASSTFKRMLAQDGFAESVRNEVDGLYHIMAHDWDPEAFLIVLRIIHGRNKQVPREITLEMLAKIAVLEDYYDFGEALDVFTEMNSTLQTSLNFDNATMSESQKLLHEHPSDSDSEPEHERKPSPRHLSPSPSSSRTTSASPAPPGSRPNGNIKRQSSFAQARPDGAPRTPNRVRFEEPRRSMNGDNNGGDWLELDGDDYLDGGDGRERTQRLPLLTGIEAPSVTVAEESFNPEDHLENARPRSGMRSAFMNMANSIIGAGIIGQPYAVRNAGLVTGTALLIGLTIVVDWTIRLIVINSKLSGTDSFQATVQHCFGKSGLIAISLAQWLLRAIMILLILGISFPLSLYRDISKLAKASGLALVSMTIIIVTVVTQAFRVPAELKGQLRGNLIIRPGIFEAIGVIAFAFVCHHNSLLIYGSLRKPTIDRFTRVTHYSTSISLVACLVMALTGYLTFGDKTLGNVLNNFPNDNLMVNIARLCFGLNMLTTLPLEAFVCREVMTNYWFPDEPYHPNRHLIFTTSLVVSALTLSLLTCDLGIVFELFGATSACALAFILPPLCYMKLSQRSWKTYLAGAVAAFGGIVMVISIIKTTSKTMMGNSEGAKCS